MTCDSQPFIGVGCPSAGFGMWVIAVASLRSVVTESPLPSSVL